MIQFSIPVAGVLPSRLLMPYRSIWLKIGASIPLPNGIHAENRNGRCSLVYDAPIRKDTIFINGQPMLESTFLHDGDFVVLSRGVHALFQEDPVMDMRKERELEEQETNDVLADLDLVPTTLQQNAILNEKGFAFNKDSPFLMWNEIAGFLIQVDTQVGNFHFSLSRFVEDDKEPKDRLPQSMLSPKEMKSFMLWLVLNAPIHLSIFMFPFAPFLDAYFVLIYQKVILPMQRGERYLPYREKEILYDPVQASAKRGILWLPFFMFCGLLVLGVITYQGGIILAAGLLVYASFILVCLFFGWLYRLLKSVVRQLFRLGDS